MRVALCAAWDAAKDGITDYAGYLARELEHYAAVERVALGHSEARKSCYLDRARECNRADLAHVQFNYRYFNGELPYRNRFGVFAAALRVPLVMTIHEVRIGFQPVRPAAGWKESVFNQTLWFWNRWSEFYHRRMYRCARKIIVHTGAQAESIRRLADCPQKVQVIPHAIPSVPDGARNRDGGLIRSKLGLAGKTVLTIFGFINRRKGYELVLDCLPGLPENAVLMIAGGPMTDEPVDRMYFSALQDKIRALGLEKSVLITGYLAANDVPDIMAATDICLAPFQSPAASGALSLCLAYHKPILASDVAVNREINSRLACLELFRSGDRDDFAAKLAGLLRNPERQAELSRLSRVYSRKYSYAEIARATFAVYTECS